MQVTQIADKVTHAVIGGGQTESFAISDSAEFFHVLSSTLYSRKEEACVREVLCNAWDAHIESGRTGTAVQVTLTDDKFIIRDFGPGIPPDMIKPIYGTYGGSTKTLNGKVTGGFGLGSKAPFAIVDHFGVDTYHEGFKTIYKMSLSSAMVGGKPSIVPIVTVPTKETGLAVTINLSEDDNWTARERRRTLEKLVRHFAAMGEMKVELNGELIETYEFSKATNGYLIIRSNEIQVKNSDQVMYVRYGNVIYPIDDNAAYSSIYADVKKFLAQLENRSHYYGRDGSKAWTIIVQAEPDTISVTPSRESLSMTTRTIETIEGLLRAFNEHTSNRFNGTVLQMNRERVKNSWLNNTPKELFDVEKLVPEPKGIGQDKIEIISDVAAMSRTYMNMGYPRFSMFDVEDFSERLSALLESGYGNRGLIQSFVREFKEKGSRPSLRTDWLIRRVIGLITRKMVGNPDVRLENLRVYTKNMQVTDKANRSRGGSEYENAIHVHAKSASMMNFQKCMPFLRNIIVLAYNRKDVDERVCMFPEMRFWFGKSEEFMVYMVPRNVKKVEAARAFVQSLGMHVIDLTIAHKWEEREVIEPAITIYAPKKDKIIGLPIVSSMNSRIFNGQLYTTYAFQADAKRIETFEYVLRVSQTQDARHTLDSINLDRSSAEAFVRLYGDRGAVISTAPQEDKYVGLGAKKAIDFLIEQIMLEYQTNPLIEEHYRTRDENEAINADHKADTIYMAMREDPILRREFKLTGRTKLHEHDVINLYYALARRYEHKKSSEFIAIEKLIQSWKPLPAVASVFAKLKASSLTDTVAGDYCRQIFTSHMYKFKTKEATRAIIRIALKG